MIEMEFGHMRDFSEFCEQLHEIRLKFHKWDSCERTVAIYYLMVGLPFANARFLQHALDQCIAAASTPEAQALERNANDSNYISNFLTERPQVALSLLLTHLPLLRPGNKETANCYLQTIRRVLTEFITPPYKIYNECVEIMSYVFIHPAFDKDDKKSFKHLLKQVLNRVRVSPDNFVHSPANEFSDESVSPNPESTSTNRRSNSLTLNENASVWSSSQENIAVQPVQKPRSYSLSNDKSANLVGTSGLQSSSSETRLQELQIMNNLPIMKSIVSWLKSLRLHKYSWVFNNLTYSQMLSLTDETLQAIGITKGARHKILLSISKLKERGGMLTELETDVMNGGDINVALKKLKSVLQSPLQVTTGEDLPGQFVKVLGRVFSHLLMVRQPTDEVLLLFNSLCERAETLEAFTEAQKRRMNVWKGQLTKETVMPVYNQRQSSTLTNQRLHNVQFQASTSKPTYAQKSSSYPNMQHNPALNTHRHSIGSVTIQNQLLAAPPTSAIFQIHVPHSNNSLKSNNSQFHVRFEEAESKESVNNIESSLESLCLQMMEHALGP